MVRIDNAYEIDSSKDEGILIKDLKRGGEVLVDLEITRTLIYLLMGILDARSDQFEEARPFTISGIIKR